MSGPQHQTEFSIGNGAAANLLGLGLIPNLGEFCVRVLLPSFAPSFALCVCPSNAPLISVFRGFITALCHFVLRLVLVVPDKKQRPGNRLKTAIFRREQPNWPQIGLRLQQAWAR